MRLLTPARRRAAVLGALGCTAAAAALPATAGAAAAPATPGRAYELVSSADTGGLDVANRIGGQSVMASTTDDAALFATLGTGPGGQADILGNSPLLARRTATGWTNTSVTPPLTPGVPRPNGLPNGITSGATPDLSAIVVATNQPMVAGTDTTIQNLFSRAFGPAGDGAPTLLGAASQYVYIPPAVQGVSADGRTVLFMTADQVTPDAPAPFSGNLYLAHDGVTTLISRKADGTPDPNGVSSLYPAGPTQHLLSPDGRNAFWVSGTGGKVFVRHDGVTTEASAPQGGTTGTPSLWAASRDGSKVFFASSGKLLPGSSPGGTDAYMYDVASGTLTDLTPSSLTGVNGPSMRFLAASDDGDTVYFIAFAALTADTPGAVARPIYRWHAGALTYVGAMDPSSAVASNPAISDLTSVSADGRYLAYPSALDNTAQPTGGTTQLYRYDATTGTTACASCPPDGSAADTAIEPYGAGYGIFATFSFVSPNSVTSDGDVVFTTPAALTPDDVNGQDDVYAWTPGTGAALVSDGADPAGAKLGDVSRDGTDIYFTTRDALVRADDDQDADLYDARRGGGFPDSAPVKGGGDCSGDACQGTPPVAPAIPAPATVTFSGPGNAIEDASIPAIPAGVKVSKGAIKGGRFTVSVRVPGAGRITASGAHVGTVRRTAAKAGSYRLTVALTAKAKRSLARHRKLKVSVKVGFTPAGEKSSNATLSLTVKA